MDSILNDLIGGSEHLNLTLLVPVVFVIVGAVLVFALGFKKPKEPQFKKIAASSDSAAAGLKKPKRKERPTPSKSNGNVPVAASSAAATSTKDQSAVAKKSTAAATPKKEPKQQSQVVTKKKEQSSPKKSTAAAAKKSTIAKPEKVRKPADFDEGEWTKVPSRTDKKKNKDDLTMTQMIDSVLSANKKSSDNKKKDGKGTAANVVKNAKQLKDQENKTKKEAAEVNKKNIKNKTVADNDSNDNNNTESKILDNILVESSKKLKENIDELVAKVEKAPVQKFDENLIAANEEKSDDNKPVVAVSGGTVFNEMGDTWTEAAPKKGKKKSRKE